MILTIFDEFVQLSHVRDGCLIQENHKEFTEAARELFDAFAANATDIHRVSAGDF